MILLLGYGPDMPPRKLFLQRRSDKIDDNASSDSSRRQGEAAKQPEITSVFCWRPVNLFLFWTIAWSLYVLVLCGIYVKQYGGLGEMFRRYECGIILHSSNIIEFLASYLLMGVYAYAKEDAYVLSFRRITSR